MKLPQAPKSAYLKLTWWWNAEISECESAIPKCIWSSKKISLQVNHLSESLALKFHLILSFPWKWAHPRRYFFIWEQKPKIRLSWATQCADKKPPRTLTLALLGSKTRLSAFPRQAPSCFFWLQWGQISIYLIETSHFPHRVAQCNFLFHVEFLSSLFSSFYCSLSLSL